MGRKARLKDPNYLVGKRFGRWTVIERAGNRKNGSPLWKCRCDCGTVRIIQTSTLTSGRSRSCGCSLREKPKSLIGKKFGMLTVLDYLGNDVWKCYCENCGRERDIKHIYAWMRNDKISCGCYLAEKNKRYDLTGKRAGRYLILKRVSKDRFRNTNWLCRDDKTGREVILSRQQLRHLMRIDKEKESARDGV